MDEIDLTTAKGDDTEETTVMAVGETPDAQAVLKLNPGVFSELMRQLSRGVYRTVSRRQNKPFSVDDEIIQRLDEFVSSKISDASGGTPERRIEVGLPDESSEQFSSLQEMAKSIDLGPPPSSLEMSWHFASSDTVESYEVTISFATERSNSVSRLNGPDHSATAIEVEVIAPEKVWAREIADSLMKLTSHAALPRSYHVLYPLRNDQVLSVLSGIMGLLTLFALLDIASALLLEEYDVNEPAVILAESDLDSAFRQYVVQFYSGPEALGFGVVSVIIFVSLGMVYIYTLVLRRAVPRSFIAIGLHKGGAESYLQTLEILVFGIVLALLVALTANAFSAFLF